MPILAINGGPPEAPTLGRRTPEWPTFTSKDKSALLDVLESRKWCRIYLGSKTETLEKTFSKYHDAKYGIATANGTVSLELALRAMGVGFSDEVIVPALTFIATASAVTSVGAIPVFADVNPETGTLDSKAVENVISKKTKAVIVVHYGGYPADMDALPSVTKKLGLMLLEDSAHAHGTEWRGHKVGSIAEMGSFSFQESKPLTAGEGGMVLTNDDDLEQKARLIHNVGRVVGKPGYEHFTLSSNYRMSEFHAALLLSQFESFPSQLDLKERNASYLVEKLGLLGITAQKSDTRITKHGYYKLVMQYNSENFDGVPRARFIAALNAEGVPVVAPPPLLYKQPAFQEDNLKRVLPKVVSLPDYSKVSLPNSERFNLAEISLFHQVLLSDKEVMDLIVSCVEKIQKHIDELKEIHPSISAH